MRILAAPAILFALLLGIGCHEKDDCDIPPLQLTPRGYWVHIPELQGGVTKEQVMGILEKRIDEWAISRSSEYYLDYLYSIAYKYPYIVYDHWALLAEQSASGLAAGRIQRNGRCKRIELALYSRGKSVDYPTGEPEHVIMWGGDVAAWTGNPGWNTGYWYYGYRLNDANGLPATGHELDHAIGIHHD